MALFGNNPKKVVGRIEVSFADDDAAHVEVWVDEAEREERGYHLVLHFLMYYARLLFFLSFRDEAEELVGWMEDAVRELARTPEGDPVRVARGWQALPELPSQPRAVWSSTLTLVGPGSYRCADARPADPADHDAQGVALLHLQHLVDTVPALERAYLALGITGMHEYYREVIHWNNSKALHPAPRHGMDHARKVLSGR